MDEFQHLRDYIIQLPSCSKHPLYMETRKGKGDITRLVIFAKELDWYDYNLRLLSISEYNIALAYTKKEDIVFYLYVFMYSKLKRNIPSVTNEDFLAIRERAHTLYRNVYQGKRSL